MINPIHHWKLNDPELSETTQLIADTGLNKSGNASGYDVVMSQTGHIERSIGFTGSSYIVANNVTLKNETSQFLWLNCNTGGTLRLFNQNTGANFRNLSLVNGYLNAYDGVNGVFNSTQVNDGNWHNVGIVYKTNDINFYIDGAKDKVGSGSTFVLHSITSNFLISDTTATYNGNLEDVRIYDQALTDWEIKQIYNEGAGTYRESIIEETFNDDNLIHHWKLNDGTTTIQDYGSNQEHLYATNNLLSQTGHIDKCIGFTGTSSGVLTITSLNLEASITAGCSFMGWVQPSNTSAKSAWYFSGLTTGSLFTELLFDGGNANIYMGRLGFNNIIYIEAVTTGSWYHVAAIKDKDKQRYYFNGVEVLNSTTSNDCSSVIRGFLGARSGTSLYYIGCMEDFRIYNKALSAREVKQIYNYGSGTYNQKFDDSPIHHWKLNDSVNQIHDYGLNPVTGTASNCLLSQTGHIERSVEFTGSSYIDIRNTLKINSTTVSSFCWFKLGDDATSGSCPLISYGSSANARLRVIDNRVVWAFWDGGSSNYLTSTTYISTGVWYHAGVVRDISSGMGLYINGTIEGSNSGIGNPSSYSIFDAIGRFGSSYYDGYIEDVRIYDRALTTEEIAKLYNGSKGTYRSDVSDKRLPSNVITSTVTDEFVADGTIYQYERYHTWDKIDNIQPFHHYKMNEYSGTTIANDSGTNPQIGSLVSVVLSQTGQINRCMEFTGTASYISITGATFGNGNSTISSSFAFWVSSTQNTESITGIYFQDSDASNRVSVDWSVNEDNIMGLRAHGTYYPIASAPADGNFHHIVGVFNEYQCYMYQDGARIGTETTMSDYAQYYTGTTSKIGFNGSTYFNGYLEDFRIYSHALTDAEVSAIYNNGKGTYDHGYRSGFPTAKDPIHHWKLQEGSGNLASDSGSEAMTPASITDCILSQTGFATGIQSFEFTGTASYVNCGTSPALNLSTNDFSMFAWVNLTTETISTIYVDKESNNIAANPGLWFACDTRTGSRHIDTQIYDGASGANIVSDNNVLTTTGWQLVGFSVNRSSNIQFYVNALSSGSSDISAYSGDLSNTFPSYIGRFVNTLHANGYISDVRIYNYALSSEEVKNLYNLGKGTLL